jgi:Uma2 family endonuclease
LKRGLEADDCYYIQHAKLADERGTDIDLDRDPPPDLAIETDITHSTVDKEAIYAALRVPELWRWDQGRLRIRLLAADGNYTDSPTSAALPMLPPDVVEQFVLQRFQKGEWRAKRAFREWV